MVETELPSDRMPGRFLDTHRCTKLGGYGWDSMLICHQLGSPGTPGMVAP